MENCQKIAITIGDPSGVGAEVIRAWAENSPQERKVAEVIAHADFLRTLPSDVSTRQIGDVNFSAIAGKPSKEGARVAFEALELSASGCAQGLYRAVVTAPISKAQMREVGFEFAGQTEFFADRWGGVPVMCFAGEKLLLSLVTWHEPLCDISTSINAEKIARAVRCVATLTKKMRGIAKPRIAVCGLNPHAGEGGILGREEIQIINPALENLRCEFENLSESLPPDTVFERVLKGEFDCAVAMYHDQGLAPLKALEFDKAVNISMNLPFVRTSPDHGTGFSIAGKGVADWSSFACAFKAAIKLSARD